MSISEPQRSAESGASGVHAGGGWSPESWRGKPFAQDVAYPDRSALERSFAALQQLPPLVTSWEIERLRSLLAEAETGKRFLLQGGDCAEAMSETRADLIANKLKILLQMSMVLIHAAKKPVIRMGRLAGQYAKPRSSATETRTVDGRDVTLPSYFGDLVNSAEFTAEARTPDPALLLRGYKHAALTLNFVRSLVDGGFADLHHPEYWDLSFFKHASLAPRLRDEYSQMVEKLADGLRFMEALGEKTVEDLTGVEFFISHEGLNLWYESAQTRHVPRRGDAWYNLTTHMPWIGERTRALAGAHVEYFRGIRNPVGVKVGPKMTGDELIDLSRILNPENERGKLVIITRMGAGKVAGVLPKLVESFRGAGRNGLWICDPMHGNGMTTSSGVKTRSFDAILDELESTHEIHDRLGTPLGGVHFELTGEDVTECVGGASGLSEADLTTNYQSQCDPRLNYQQALEMAFLLARRMGKSAGRK